MVTRKVVTATIENTIVLTASIAPWAGGSFPWAEVWIQDEGRRYNLWTCDAVEEARALARSIQGRTVLLRDTLTGAAHLLTDTGEIELIRSRITT